MPQFDGLLVRAAGGRDSALTGRGPGWTRSFGDGVWTMSLGSIGFTDPELAGMAHADGVARALVRGWRTYGAQLPKWLTGAYLLALWEPDADAGIVAVDRFSTLPLYFREASGTVAFAMRPARVCELLDRSCEVSATALVAYAWFHEIPAPLSVFEGVRRLEGGEVLVFDREGSKVERHWQPEFRERRPFGFDVQRDAFMEALRSAVAECARDVDVDRLGCFLSGGTDSSTIAGLVSQRFGRGARTFSIVFDETRYDESRYSRIAARHFGTEHTEHVLTADEATAQLDVLASSFEQPFGNSSALPTYVCARIARDAGVELMLGGDGGDELYGGNERYATQWLLSLYDRAPRVLREACVEPVLSGPLAGLSTWPVRKARSYVEQARMPLPDRLGGKYNLLARFGFSSVFTEDVLERARGFDPLDLEREVWRRSEGAALVNRMLAYDFKFTLADNDLPKVTRMCHAAGVDVAFPMLRASVVDHSLELPAEQKLRRTKLRHFFREALRGFLPDEIIDKPKHGFGMPFGEWLLRQPALAARADDALGSLASRGYVRREFLSELRGAIHSGHAGYFGVMTWVLMMLELWIRAHLDARDRARDAVSDRTGGELRA